MPEVTEDQIIEKYQFKKINALRKGVKFDLSLLSISNLMKAKRCFYTGVELTLDKNKKNSITFDRVDPKKGYIKGNVVASSFHANNLKSQFEHNKDFNIKSFKKQAKALYNSQGLKSNRDIISSFFKALFIGNDKLPAKCGSAFYERFQIIMRKKSFGGDFIENMDKKTLKNELFKFCKDLKTRGILNVNDVYRIETMKNPRKNNT